MWGKFDAGSRIKELSLLTEKEIEDHAYRHDNEEVHYTGPTLDELKRSSKAAGTADNRSPSYSGYMRSGAASGDDFGNMYYG